MKKLTKEQRLVRELNKVTELNEKTYKRLAKKTGYKAIKHMVSNLRTDDMFIAESDYAVARLQYI